MQTVQRLKKELRHNQELAEYLAVLKRIAASEFSVLEKQRERFAKFTESFDAFFRLIDPAALKTTFASSALGIIMITSDEGFMGGLNAQVINKALEYQGSDKARLIILGERGAGYLRELGLEFEPFSGITSEYRYEEAKRLKDFIMREALAEKLGKVVIVYPKPLSFTVQKIEVLKILPCEELFSQEKMPADKEKEVILESPLDSIVAYLLETWITEKLFEVFEDSKLAEFSARTVRLEESHQELMKRGRDIRYQYLRSRHSLIDKDMREAYAAGLMKKNK